MLRNMNDKKTQWKPIPQYEGLYEVSENGDAAALYDTLPGLRCSSRAWVIRRLIRKLNIKFQNQLNHDKK